MRTIILLLIPFALLLSCNKDGGSPAPEAAVMVFPANNSSCVTATADDGKSTINFKWTAAAHADSYEIVIKDLVSNLVYSKTATGTNVDITLPVNSPYSWTVLSRNDANTGIGQSEVWKFYNAGPGKLTVAPFPAEIVSPTMGQALAITTKVKLDWTGSDADNDISNYDVYLGTTSSPALLQANIADSELDNVVVSSGNIYYWRVVTRDKEGNTSTSGTYVFKIN